jgi:hypothetical protein
MSEDLPLPDEPITAINLLFRSFISTSSICPSLPKKRCDSSLEKGRSPGKGLTIS